ncbi:MAG: flagellar hook-associated protein FlgL [bacterium]
MRVSDQLRHSTYLADLNKRLENLYRLQQELSTGRRLRVPSDDPTEASRALRLEECLKRQDQFLRNIENAQSWTNFADARLQEIVELITEIDSLAVRADNDDQTEQDRQAAALEIDQKLEQLWGLANSRFNDRFVFGGWQTLSTPFADERDVDGRIISVSANAATIGGEIYRQIGEDERLRVNMPGNLLFQPVGSQGTDDDLFYVVIELRNTIANNNTPPEGYEETRSNPYLREQLAQIRERFTEQQAYLGSLGQRLQDTTGRLLDYKITLTDALEKAEGVDITDIATRIATEEYAYQAMLSLGAHMFTKSLVDFLS